MSHGQGLEEVIYLLFSLSDSAVLQHHQGSSAVVLSGDLGVEQQYTDSRHDMAHPGGPGERTAD